MARGSPRLRTADDKINQIGTRLRSRRDALQLTQDALCGRLAYETAGRWNAHRMEIYRLEIGTRAVTDLGLLALAKALECDVTWLLLGNRRS